MIKISRQEADAIRKQIPNAKIVVVNRTKKYKKYWAEEDRNVMRMLNQMRGIKQNKYTQQRKQKMRGDGYASK